jgi:hypothetical protein
MIKTAYKDVNNRNVRRNIKFHEILAASILSGSETSTVKIDDIT